MKRAPVHQAPIKACEICGDPYRVASFTWGKRRPLPCCSATCRNAYLIRLRNYTPPPPAP